MTKTSKSGSDCPHGLRLLEMFVNALTLGRPNAVERERDWQEHKDKCPVCAGVKEWKK